MATPHFPAPSPTILLPHLPPKTLVGIDLITFTSTPNFHGIRDLPRGWHFLYTGTTELLSLRCGAWFYVGGDIPDPSNNGGMALSRQQHGVPEVIIWRWNTDTEALEPLNAGSDADQQEAMRYKANLGAIWQGGGLFRYRSRVSVSSLPLSRPGESQPESVPRLDEFDEKIEQEGQEDWRGLTNSLSPRLLTRIVGEPALNVDGCPRWTVTTASTADRDNDEIPGLSASNNTDESVEGARDQEKELSFIPVDLKMTWREGAIGRERTEAARDRSWALGDLIRRFSEGGGGDERIGEAQVLGELQFTFLMGMTLMNFSCLQQWKRLLRLILTCRSAIVERELFTRDVLRLLLLQLQRCDDVEGGLFDLDGEDGSEFLRKLLRGFRSALYEALNGTESSVKAEFELLEAWVKQEYDWELNREAFVHRGMLQLEDGEQVEIDLNENDEDEETGEYAPVVVDLEGTGAMEER